MRYVFLSFTGVISSIWSGITGILPVLFGYYFTFVFSCACYFTFIVIFFSWEKENWIPAGVNPDYIGAGMKGKQRDVNTLRECMSGV